MKGIDQTMKKKITVLLIFLLAVSAILAACSSTTQSSNTQSTQIAEGFDPATRTMDQKLAIGTLKLEGTDLAVTAEEATTLLPLWKAVKSLSSSDTTAPEELTALYQQIQDSMTKEQVQAIEDMQLTQDDMNTLMQDLGIQVGGPGMNQDFANLSDDERATRIAEIQSQNPDFSSGGGPGNFPGGGNPPEGAGPQGGDAGMVPPSGDLAGQGGSLMMGTQMANGTPTGFRRQGMNTIFVDPVINLLTERSGS
jgi:hypothetical protein